jgi:hypothetical protein
MNIVRIYIMKAERGVVYGMNEDPPIILIWGGRYWLASSMTLFSGDMYNNEREEWGENEQD